MSSKQAEDMKEKGNAEFKKGNYEKAIEFYTYATEMDPNNHVFYTNRAMCYAAMKKWDKSLRDAETSVKLKKDWEKGHYRRGMALQNLGKLQEAVQAFSECVKLSPQTADFQKALDGAKKEMFKGMSDAEILKMEGNELFKGGKIDLAIKKYSDALSKLPDDAGLTPVSSTTANAPPPDEKDKKIEKDRITKADIYANRAACFVQLYEPTKVKADCDAALRLIPGHGKALLRRGQALESLEKYKAALDDFETVLKQDPGCKMAVTAAVRLRNALRRQNAL